jgi:hypothetical protein
MDDDFNTGFGKTPAPHPSRTWADDASSDDDDCIILEVYDPVPNSYAYSVNPASADPDAQVLEDTMSLAAQKTAAPKTTRGSKRASPLDSGPSAPPSSKRRKVGCQGLPGAKNRSRAPLTSYG